MKFSLRNNQSTTFDVLRESRNSLRLSNRRRWPKVPELPGKALETLETPSFHRSITGHYHLLLFSSSSSTHYTLNSGLRALTPSPTILLLYLLEHLYRFMEDSIAPRKLHQLFEILINVFKNVCLNVFFQNVLFSFRSCWFKSEKFCL